MITCDKCDELEASVKKVTFDGTTESDTWSGLDLEDFTDESWESLDSDEQMEIANNFLVSRSGWPADNFSDLGFEVVDTDGNLDLQALRAAKTRSGQAGDDIDEDKLKRVINELATENFDVNWVEENTMKTGNIQTRSHHTGTKKSEIKEYMYEKGKADGMYDECSPKRTAEMSMHGGSSDDEDSEKDESEMSNEELAYNSYEHEEIEAYECGYQDGVSMMAEMSEHEEMVAEMSEHGDSDEMMDSLAKGMHDGMDPDESDDAEMSAQMPDSEQMAYKEGHRMGCDYRERNQYASMSEHDTEEMASDEHMFDAESDAEDASENMPAPCENGTSHSHEDSDQYMPCSSHEQYQEAVENMPEDAELSVCPCTEMTESETKSSDDLHQVTFAESKAGLATLSEHTTTMKFDEEELEDYDDPVLVERDDFEELQSVNDNIEELRERTEVLDQVERELVEELRDVDDAIVVSESRFAELEEEAEHVKEIYAEEVAEEAGLFTADELMEKHSLDELRSKFDEMEGDLEEELEADPKGGDPSEEELEASETEEKTETEELAEQKREELKNKIFD